MLITEHVISGKVGAEHARKLIERAARPGRIANAKRGHVADARPAERHQIPVVAIILDVELIVGRPLGPVPQAVMIGERDAGFLADRSIGLLG